MAEWARVVNTTIAEYVKGYEENVLRNRKLLAMMTSKGKVTFNHFGDKCVWRVRHVQTPMQGYADTETLQFPRRNKWKSPELEWRGYASTESLTKKERLMNKGAAQIINMFAEISKLQMEDIKDLFGEELYIDGNATNNEKRLHGAESFFANTGVSTSAPIAVNDDSYAGLDTDLAAYGGTWTGTWPDGTGDSEYDFWSPLLVDYTSTVAASLGGWTAATKTWPNTCSEAMRFAITYSGKNRTLEEQMDFFLLEAKLYRQYLDSIASERIMVNRGQDSALVKLGFKDVTNLDGIDITSEYGVASGVGYGFNVDKVELKSLQGQLFVPTGPDFDIGSQSWRMLIDMFGNMSWNPRFQTKLKNYS